MRHGDGRFSVLRPDTDSEGERVLDVPVSDLLEVRLSRRADDTVVIEIYLRYPAPVLTGLPADRTPLPVLIAEHDVAAAATLVSQLNEQILAARRIDVAAPDLTPPPVEYTPTGPQRADVNRAVGRMAATSVDSGAVEALQRYVTDTEYVLETAMVDCHAPLVEGRGLLAITTERLLVHPVGETESAYELPIPMIVWAHSTSSPTPDSQDAARPTGGAGIDIFDGNRAVHFRGEDRADTERVTCAVNFVVRLTASDGATGPIDPGVAQLYSEWELLVERHSLGMIDDSQFQRYGRGILRSLPVV